MAIAKSFAADGAKVVLAARRIEAGVTTPPVPLTELEEEEFDRVMNINTKGMWLCLKYQIPQMIKNGGKIVNVTSMWGIGASQFPVAAYTASKHAAEGLTKAAALEYAKHNINAISTCLG